MKSSLYTTYSKLRELSTLLSQLSKKKLQFENT